MNKDQDSLKPGAKKDNNLVRFSVTMPEDLLVSFDAFVAQRGIAKNRSEVVRDLVREALVKSEVSNPGAEVMGTVTIVYDHHATDLPQILHSIQHQHLELVISSTHVHLDATTCLEVIILRGEAALVHDVSNRILGTKGVKNGDLMIVATGEQA